jgi:MFS family permease
VSQREDGAGAPGAEAETVRSRVPIRVQVRELPKETRVLYVGTFLNRAATSIPFIALYLTSLGYSARSAGLGLAAYGMGALVSQPVGGVLADRFGRKATISISMSVSALLLIVLIGLRSLGSIVADVALLGAFAELYRPASAALITDLVPRGRRVTAFTVQRLAVNAGWAFGLALGGFLSTHSFVLLFAADAITSGAFGLIALIWIPHGVRRSPEHQRTGGVARAIASDRGYLLFLLAILLGATLYMQDPSTFALQVVSSLGYSRLAYGLLLSLNGIVILFAELAVTSITQRFDRLRMVALGSVLIGIAFGSLIFAHTLPPLVAMILIATLAEMIESPNASAFVADRAPEQARGRYQAAFGMMWAAAAVIGPIGGTALFHVSPNLLWSVCLISGIAGGGLALAARRDARPS